MYNYIIFLPTFVSLIWLIIFLTTYSEQNKANKFIPLFFITTGILYFCNIFYFKVDGIGKLEPLYLLCNQSVYPLYLIYIFKLTRDKFKLGKFVFLFLPAFVLSICALLMHTLGVIEVTNVRLKVMYIARLVFFNVNIIIFIMFALHSIIAFRQRVMNFYSESAGKDLKNIESLLYVFVATSVLAGTANALGRSFFIYLDSLLMVVSISFAVLLFLVGFYSYKQKFSVENLVLDEGLSLSDDSSSPHTRMKPPGHSPHNSKMLPKSHTVSQIKASVSNLFDKENIYLQSELTVSDLAARFHSNRTYISNIINEEFGMSFSQIVNVYRISYAKNLMLKDPTKQYSLVAEESGFANEQSFYRNFRKIEGRTPNAWKNSIQ